jgi:hypothetical protein
MPRRFLPAWTGSGVEPNGGVPNESAYSSHGPSHITGPGLGPSLLSPIPSGAFCLCVVRAGACGLYWAGESECPMADFMIDEEIQARLRSLREFMATYPSGTAATFTRRGSMAGSGPFSDINEAAATPNAL